MIIQNVGVDGATNLGFTVPQNELELAKNAMQKNFKLKNNYRK